MSVIKVKTLFGQFRVKESDRLISIGGNKWCVQIVYTDDPTNTDLISLHTDTGDCEMTNKQIHGPLTQKMVHLAFTILSQKKPLIKYVNLIDSSSVTCILPDGIERKMSLMKSSLLLYGQTYYERKFEAYPENPLDIENLEKFRRNYEDPTKKPDVFSFNNKDLQKLLEPIYKTSSTWKEFMIELHKIYGKHICEYIYPWFLHALGKITDREITSKWRINIHDKPIIKYTIIPEGGGSWSIGGKTRRNMPSTSRGKKQWSATIKKTRRNNNEILYVESEPDYEPYDLYDIKYI